MQLLVGLVWLGVFASLVLFCWELAWKLQAVRSALVLGYASLFLLQTQEQACSWWHFSASLVLSCWELAWKLQAVRSVLGLGYASLLLVHCCTSLTLVCCELPRKLQAVRWACTFARAGCWT